MNKYVISNNYYTTDANIIYKLNKSRYIEILSEILACMAALCFAAMFVFIFIKVDFLIPVPIIFLAACITITITSYFVGAKSEKLETEALNEFYTTEEYEEQREEIMRGKKYLEDKKAFLEAKYIVEIFYTLNNKRMSKKSKIQKIKNILLSKDHNE